MRVAIAVALMLAPSIVPTAGAADPGPDAAAPAQREFAAAYAVLANMKINVAEAWASSGRFPLTYSEARFEGPINASNFAIELGSEGSLRITFNESADPTLAGTEVTAVPTVNESGDIVWHCLAPRIPRHVRPGCVEGPA